MKHGTDCPSASAVLLVTAGETLLSPPVVSQLNPIDFCRDQCSLCRALGGLWDVRWVSTGEQPLSLLQRQSMKLLIVHFALFDINPVQLFQLLGISTLWSSTVGMMPCFVIHVFLVKLYFFVDKMLFAGKVTSCSLLACHLSIWDTSEQDLLLSHLCELRLLDDVW